jgi:hypothetical protein
LDYLVYAPLGLALEARDLLPKLADRGRGQVVLARLAGRFAAQRGQHEIRRVVSASGSDERSESETAPSIPVPFDGYDELKAKNILPRLDSMTERELDRALAYELHHRSRSTIINRLRQLRG